MAKAKGTPVTRTQRLQEDIVHQDHIERVDAETRPEHTSEVSAINLLRNGVSQGVHDALIEPKARWERRLVVVPWRVRRPALSEAESRERIYTDRVTNAFVVWIRQQMNSGRLNFSRKVKKQINGALDTYSATVDELHTKLLGIVVGTDSSGDPVTLYDRVAHKFDEIVRQQRADMQIYDSMESGILQTRLNAFLDPNSPYRLGHVATGGWTDAAKQANAGRVGDLLTQLTNVDHLRIGIDTDDATNALMLHLSRGFSDAGDPTITPPRPLDNLSGLVAELNAVQMRLAAENPGSRDMETRRNEFFSAGVQLADDFAAAQKLNEELVDVLKQYHALISGGAVVGDAQMMAWKVTHDDVIERRNSLWTDLSSHEQGYLGAIQGFLVSVGQIPPTPTPAAAGTVTSLQTLRDELPNLQRRKSKKNDVFPNIGLNNVTAAAVATPPTPAAAIVSGLVRPCAAQTHVRAIDESALTSDSNAMRGNRRIDLKPYELLYHLNYERLADVADPTQRELQALLAADREVLRAKFADEQGAINEYVAKRIAEHQGSSVLHGQDGPFKSVAKKVGKVGLGYLGVGAACHGVPWLAGLAAGGVASLPLIAAPVLAGAAGYGIYHGYKALEGKVSGAITNFQDLLTVILDLLPEAEPLGQLYKCADEAAVRKVIEDNNLNPEVVKRFTALLSASFKGIKANGQTISFAPDEGIFMDNLIDAIRITQSYATAKNFAEDLGRRLREDPQASRIGVLGQMLAAQHTAVEATEDDETRRLVANLQKVFSEEGAEEMFRKFDAIRKNYEEENPIPDDDKYNNKGTIRQLLAWAKRELAIRKREKKEAGNWKDSDKALWALYKRSAWRRFGRWIWEDIGKQNWILPWDASDEEKKNGSVLGNWWKRGKNRGHRRLLRAIGRKVPIVKGYIKNEGEE